jgi:hypothetical protein
VLRRRIFGGIESGNLEIDFVGATGNGFSAMKSAYELAMERLQKNTPSASFTDEQKAQLAEIDSQVQAKIAEKKIFLSQEIEKAIAAGQVDEVEKLQRQLTSEIRRLQDDCDLKKEKLRDSFKA